MTWTWMCGTGGVVSEKVLVEELKVSLERRLGWEI